MWSLHKPRYIKEDPYQKGSPQHGFEILVDSERCADVAFGQDSYHCVEDGLDLGLIHSDPKAFYISMDMDPRGDLYVGGRGQACIDEFEIFGPDSQTNLALAGRASGSSVLPGHASKHQIAFLND
ncbi:MAG: hypothetical protein ACKVHR_08640 [Pirellulales bacterium]